MRTLTTNAITEKSKEEGAQFIRILEVQWGGALGTKYYIDQGTPSGWDSTAYPLESLVMSFGDLSLEVEPGTVGGYDSVTLELADPTLKLKELYFEIEHGAQTKLAYVHLWFFGTTWPDDRVTLFGGVLSTPFQWTQVSGGWSITMKSFGEKFDRQIGFVVNREAFPEINCDKCEGNIIPIVYGDPTYRVPACLVDHPGMGHVGTTFNIHDDPLIMLNSAVADGFTLDTTISLVIGYPGNYEIVTGSFDDVTDRTKFNVFTRGHIQASGQIAGCYAVGGITYIMLPRAAFFDPAISLAGYPLYLANAPCSDPSGWITQLITMWSMQGSSVVVTPKGDLDISCTASTCFKVGARPYIPIWPVGTPVYEQGSWTYITNFLPSESVVRVEAKASTSPPGGSNSNESWFTYNSAFYNSNINDIQYNLQLGRKLISNGDAIDDPGVTTVTVLFAPAQLGFKDNNIYITLRGIEDSDPQDGTGDAYSNPADVIKSLLTNPFLGNITEADFVDVASFTAAKTDITTKFAFALMDDEKKLMSLAAELAFQGLCVIFWDQGKLFLRYVDNTIAAVDSVLTITEANDVNATLTIEEEAIGEIVTEGLAEFVPYITGPTLKFRRISQDGIDAFGMTRETFDLWAYQYPTSVALALEHWLFYFLHRHRLVELKTRLNALDVQPADIVTLDISHDSKDVLDSVLGQATALIQTAGAAKTEQQEHIQVRVPLKLWDFTLVPAPLPSDDECNPPLGDNPNHDHTDQDLIPDVGDGPPPNGEATTGGADKCGLCDPATGTGAPQAYRVTPPVSHLFPSSDPATQPCCSSFMSARVMNKVPGGCTWRSVDMILSTLDCVHMPGTQQLWVLTYNAASASPSGWILQSLSPGFTYYPAGPFPPPFNCLGTTTFTRQGPPNQVNIDCEWPDTVEVEPW